MFRFVLLILMICSGLVSSEKIILKVNASNYIEGTAAKLSCLFPQSINEPLQWGNMDNVLDTKLRCKTPTSCTELPGYHVSRVGNNLTLIIDRVNRTAYRWKCSPLSLPYSEIAVLNISENPPLHLKISKDGTLYQIKTSCSAILMNVTCQLDEETLGLKDVESRPCSNPIMSYMHGTIMTPSHTGTIKCTVDRNAESYSDTYKILLNYMYYIGGVLVVAGLIIVVLSIIKRYEHICSAGISVILFGLGFLAYNHVFGVFVAFLVLGGIVAVLTIVHMFYVNKHFYSKASV